jgi:hypothetical protein
VDRDRWIDLPDPMNEMRMNGQRIRYSLTAFSRQSVRLLEQWTVSVVTRKISRIAQIES